MDGSTTEADIEKMVVRLVAETRQLLVQRRPFLATLALRLATQGSLTATDVAEVAGCHDVHVEVRPEGHQWAPAYHESLDSAG